MAAFERIRSGIPEMDREFDSIRLGDNVVWRVSDLSEFRLFMEPFAEQAVRDRRNIIYVRFATHRALLEPREGLKIVTVPLSSRFETFTIAIHELIEREGKDAFYVFDCLSELQTAWSTDLMMGNFFRLTCPFLFRLDTVAFFPVIRGKHSFEAIAKIRDTTQLFLDVYSDGKTVYVRPMKIWNRYSAAMFLPHVYTPETGKFTPVLGGVEISAFYQLMNRDIMDSTDRNADSWDRFFQQTELLWKNGFDVSEACGRMCDIMLTRDPRMRTLIRESFRPEDYFAVRSRMIGTGQIGGKACGMLLSRKLVENRRPDLAARLEPHDSFYVGSDVYYACIVDNGLWDLHVRQRGEEDYFRLADEVADRLLHAVFPATLEEQFARMLDYYGQDPYIVRSSSLLEDGFGNAFAGKYESVFCSNSGTAEERMEELENAVRAVYASTMSLSALDYRLRRGLEKKDEQMALLVQRVSGSRYENCFMPCAAGVGYSVSPYRYGPGGNGQDGMLRLVMGLGTAAVDRKEGSYPRIVSLSDPEGGMRGPAAERHRYSQQKADAVNMETGRIDSLPVSRLPQEFPLWLKKQLLTHDRDAERIFAERGEDRDVCYISCDGIVKNHALMEDMKAILVLLAEAYDYPVDIEFTINLSENGGYVIDLLQCRPLQTGSGGKSLKIPDVPEETVFLKTKHASMGFSRELNLDYVVLIDAVGYYRMPYREKYRVRDAVSAVNWKLRGQGKQLLLIAPGRICTSSPELGVPTAFSDISEFSVIAEAAEDRAGYMPELSYGSHIFQDLVEAGILYAAVFRDARTEIFRPERFAETENRLPEFFDGAGELEKIVRVTDVSKENCMLRYDMISEQLLCTWERKGGDHESV